VPCPCFDEKIQDTPILHLIGMHCPHLPAAQTTTDVGKAACPADTTGTGEAEPAADVPACHMVCSAEETAHVGALEHHTAVSIAPVLPCISVEPG